MDDKLMVERVIKYVLTLSDEEFTALSVYKIARDLNIDRFKLSREFKIQTDMTLEDFLFKEKMTRSALMLLAYRDFTIKEVAERLGFCTCDYFIRKFKQFYGVVPGKYSEFKAKRPGIRDRREGVKDRRQKMINSNIPGTGDRRIGSKDRRQEAKDRRKLSSNHNHHDNPNTVPGRVLEIMDGKNGDPCEKCYFKRFALNFDDLK